MRILIYAAAAGALLLANTASAQTSPAAPTPPAPASRCGATPTAPTPPATGLSASQMREAVAAYDAWRASVQSNLDCRRAEALELRALADARTAEFNAASTAARDASTAFQAAVDAYNSSRGESGSSRNSTRGSAR